METSREAMAMVFRVSLLFSSIPSFPLGSHRRKKPTSHSWEMMMMMGLVMASTKDLLCYCLQICSNLWSLLLPYESSCCLVLRVLQSPNIYKSQVFFIWLLLCSGNSIKYARVLFSLCTTKYNNNQSQHWRRRGNEGKATTNNLKKKIVAWVASSSQQCLRHKKNLVTAAKTKGILWLSWIEWRRLLVVPQVLLSLLQLFRKWTL